MTNELDGNDDPTVAEFDSSYSAELMEPTADTSMGQATEKKKRDRSTDMSCNNRKQKAKAKLKMMG